MTHKSPPTTPKRQPGWREAPQPMRLLKGLSSLGSTALTTTASGVKTGDLLYKPWGETRYDNGTTPTTWRFTGQRENATIGLYFYNARYYDPVLGRFIQPDTIVPNPGNPASLNRYAYVMNNPLRYTDPTGHIEEDEVDEAVKLIQQLKELYGILVVIDFGWRPVISRSPGEPGQVWDKGAWELTDLDTVLQAVGDFAAKAGGQMQLVTR